MRSCNKLSDWLQQHWQQPKLLGWILLPFSWLFKFIVVIRKVIYRSVAFRAKIPVIIVGNITVGGTGKTPTVIYLSNLLRLQGYKVGIVTRGYKSKITRITEVHGDSDPDLVGDEAVLLAQKCDCPVIIAKRKSAGIKLLQDQVDVIICDDGLQHYLLARDIEIAIVDGANKFGNGFCLPMGPLREPISRLKTVDFVLENGQDLQLEPEEELVGNANTVHAVAGIGNPQRFFTMLHDAGYTVIAHPFPDHHRFIASDLQFADQYPILMTEKDAVKCKNLGIKFTTIKVNAKISEKFIKDFLALLEEKQHARCKLTGYTSLPNL